ncbi:MAG: hypothetical protein HJJLKODD_01881 [Phycisphaerae bacterium]|nr:hypothetical protein [Phycisphaerae bacterium]
MNKPETQVHDDPNTPAAVLVGLVGCLIIFAVIVALQALFYRADYSETVSKVYEVDPAGKQQLIVQQLEQLHTYRWINQAEGVVAVPIERALELAVVELNQPPAASQPATPDKKE